MKRTDETSLLGDASRTLKLGNPDALDKTRQEAKSLSPVAKNAKNKTNSSELLTYDTVMDRLRDPDPASPGRSFEHGLLMDITKILKEAETQYKQTHPGKRIPWHAKSFLDESVRNYVQENPYLKELPPIIVPQMNYMVGLENFYNASAAAYNPAVEKMRQTAHLRDKVLDFIKKDIPRQLEKPDDIYGIIDPNSKLRTR